MDEGVEPGRLFVAASAEGIGLARDDRASGLFMHDPEGVEEVAELCLTGLDWLVNEEREAVTLRPS